jgi:hypothetical protein
MARTYLGPLHSDSGVYWKAGVGPSELRRITTKLLFQVRAVRGASMTSSSRGTQQQQRRSRTSKFRFCLIALQERTRVVAPRSVKGKPSARRGPNSAYGTVFAFLLTFPEETASALFSSLRGHDANHLRTATCFLIQFVIASKYPAANTGQ